MAEASDTDADALRRLEERLDRAAAAAERLLADAVAAAAAGGAGGSGPPQAGGGAPGPDGRGGGADRPPRGGGGDRPPRVPPAGWQQPAPDEEPGYRWAGGELDLLLAVLSSVRDRIPPELQQRLAAAVREVLMAVRAVIDWCLERSDAHRAEPRQVQDIPIL